MYPSIKNRSFVLIKTKLKKKIFSKFLIFKHEIYGPLIKRLIKVDSQKKFWFKGDSIDSISTEKIGPIKESQIIGEVVLSVSKSKIKFY